MKDRRANPGRRSKGQLQTFLIRTPPRKRERVVEFGSGKKALALDQGGGRCRAHVAA